MHAPSRYDGEWVDNVPKCGFYSEMPPDPMVRYLVITLQTRWCPPASSALTLTLTLTLTPTQTRWCPPVSSALGLDPAQTPASLHTLASPQTPASPPHR